MSRQLPRFRKHLVSVRHGAAAYLQIVSRGKKQNKNKTSARLSMSTQLLALHEYSRGIVGAVIISSGAFCFGKLLLAVGNVDKIH